MIVKSEFCKERIQNLLEGIPSRHWPVLRSSYRVPVYAGWKAGLQVNEDLHILYVRGGEGAYVFKDGTTLPLKKGSLTMITHSLPHWGKIYHNEPLKIYGLRFELKDASQNIITKRAVRPFYFHNEYSDGAHLEQTLMAIHQRSGSPSSTIRDLEISLYLTQLMSEMHQAVSGTPQASVKDPLMSRARQLLEHHVNKKISIADLAALLDISTRYLQIRFKSSYGMTPKEYLTHLRMNRAHQMLENGTIAKTVAYTLCFSDQYAFSRQFKAYYGFSPSDVTKVL